MPYKFKSRATADLIMLDANGRKLLEIIGKSPDEVHGIIPGEQIPAAIVALEAAAAEDAARRAQPQDEAQEDAVPANQDGVALGQRIVPFVDMLRRSAADGKEVTWSVQSPSGRLNKKACRCRLFCFGSRPVSRRRCRRP